MTELDGKHIPWSLKTFGPGARTKGLVKHIQKELDEILQDPFDLYEWIDVVILGLDGAWRAGYTGEQVVYALLDKLAKIRERAYPMPVSEDEPSEHVRDELYCKLCRQDDCDGYCDCPS